MVNSLILILGLSFSNFFLVTGHANVIDQRQRKLDSNTQQGFQISPKELVLTAEKGFIDTATISVNSESDLDGLIKPDCGNICDINLDKYTVTISLKKDTFFNSKEVTKRLAFVIKKGEKDEATAYLTVKIPARISDVSTKVLVGDKEVTSLVEGETATVEVSYTLDGEKGKSDVFLEPSDKNLLEVGDGTVKAKNAGTSNIQVFHPKDKMFKIREILLKILPAVVSIESKSGRAIYMTESSDSEIKLAVKGNNDATLTTERVECKPQSPSSLLTLIKNPTGYTLRTLPLAKVDSGEAVGQILDVTCSVIGKKDGFDKADDLAVKVSVQPRAGSITVDSLNGNTLLPNGNLTFVVTAFDTKNVEQPAAVRFNLANPPLDKQWVTLSQQGKKLVVTWVDFAEKNPEDPAKRNKRPDFVNINVEATIGSNTNPVTTTIPIHMASVARFSSLKVKLNVMDERTASDLYGGVLKDEYYVLMVRLFNDLKDEEGRGSRGESILAYSSSIEVAVGLEKQFDKDLNSGTIGSFSAKDIKEIDKARSVTLREDFKNNLKVLDDMYKDLLDEYNEKLREAIDVDAEAVQLETAARTDNDRERAGRSRAKAKAAFAVVDKIAEKLRDLYNANALSTPRVPPPNAPILDGKWYPASREDLIEASMEREQMLSAEEERKDDNSAKSLEDGEPNCKDTIMYKPFTFEMMVNTVDRRDERTFRSRLFKILNFVGLGASAITAVAVPSKGSDLPLGIEKYGNLFVPGLDKLLPSLKEQNRQNIVSQAMKTIEEIPFGSDITRVVFIPKKSIHGLVGGHKVRISQICPFYFKIKVAVVSKGGEVTLRN